MAERLSVATYSIVAFDPDARQWGVAVQSKFLAVGSVVPWAEANVGAVATQAYANPQYGPDGLALLRDGLSAAEVVERLVAADDGRDDRLFGVTPDEDWLPLEGELAEEVQARVQRAGYATLHEWAGVANLEERVRD